MAENDGDLGASGLEEVPKLVQPLAEAQETLKEAKVLDVERGGIVTAKGTGQGLVIRLDGRVDVLSLQSALHDFVVSRSSFLSGNEVTFEWIGSRPEDKVVEDLASGLKQNFGISVKASMLRERKMRVGGAAGQDREASPARSDKRLSLFSGVEDLADDEDFFAGGQPIDEERELQQLTRRANQPLSQAAAWDDADARLVYATLRSGQRVETEHSLIVVGDVNSGAEVIAGGDILVLGALRGVAHAGAYDETGGGRFIFALALQPTQLRIGAIISRGGSESRKAPEIARVDDNLIVVEPYQARSALSRLRRS